MDNLTSNDDSRTHSSKAKPILCGFSGLDVRFNFTIGDIVSFHVSIDSVLHGSPCMYVLPKNEVERAANTAIRWLLISP